MKTTPVTEQDLKRSVLAVPPISRTADLSLCPDQDRRLIAHMRAGGVSTFLYGGNANLYHCPVSEYPTLLANIEALAEGDEWVIPSAGPDYGKLMDQAEILADTAFPTVMVLPTTTVTTPEGNEEAIRRFSERIRRPVILYIKEEGYLNTDQVVGLIDDGVASVVKYAVPRHDATQDDFLDRLTNRIGASRIVSGFGERPALAHMQTFGLAGFTSGCVCLAPALSMALLAAARRGAWDEAEQLRQAFLDIEDERDRIHPIRVLHEAVSAAGLAETGPILPALHPVGEPDREPVRRAAEALVERELAFRNGKALR